MIYDKVKKIAKEKNLSISALEKQSGLSNGVIRKWNSSSPTVDNLRVVAHNLGVTINDLLG